MRAKFRWCTHARFWAGWRSITAIWVRMAAQSQSVNGQSMRRGNASFPLDRRSVVVAQLPSQDIQSATTVRGAHVAPFGVGFTAFLRHAEV